MKRADVVRLVQQAVRARRLIFTSHALDEMDADGETRESVAAALLRAKSFALQDNGRWRVRGESLTVIVHIEADAVLVWTVYVG
ncbi:MAG: hypothetical protein AABZ30_13440 [Myxococcota bacterium]